jgi:hypothetical protein
MSPGGSSSVGDGLVEGLVGDFITLNACTLIVSFTQRQEDGINLLSCDTGPVYRSEMSASSHPRSEGAYRTHEYRHSS